MYDKPKQFDKSLGEESIMSWIGIPKITIYQYTYIPFLTGYGCDNSTAAKLACLKYAARDTMATKLPKLTVTNIYLTHFSLVMLYQNIDLGQPCLR